MAPQGEVAAPVAQSGAERKRVDGRVQRAVRTRAAITEATLALLAQGRLRPTSQEVAEQACVSIRAVFHHFGDMDHLVRAAVELNRSRHPFAALPKLPASGSLEERIVAFAERRAATFERIVPVHRAVLLKEGVDEDVTKRMRRARARANWEVCQAFAPELAELPDDALREALIAASSWTLWEALRIRRGLSFARARAVLEFTLRSLLLTRRV